MEKTAFPDCVEKAQQHNNYFDISSKIFPKPVLFSKYNK